MRVAAPRVGMFGLVVIVAACGASSSGHDDAGSHPGQPDAATGPGQPDAAPGTPDGGGSGGYPSAPVMVYGGDRLLLAPKVITITYPNESARTTYESFGDMITGTAWWDSVTAGYCDGAHHCIGHGSNGGHVHMSAAPGSSYTDSPGPNDPSTIKDLIKARVADHTFPAPDDNTLYVIYFPTSVTVSLKNGSSTATSCQQFGGYHTFVNVTSPATGQNVPAAYAIIPHCNALLGIDVVETASHEIIEAATDPLVSDTTANGYYMDQTRDAWLAITAAENADTCALLKAFQANPFANPGAEAYMESGYMVQKSFSNPSVLAGHNPCVPASGVYFNVKPEVEKLVMHTGDQRTIELSGFADGTTADWDVKVMDMGALTNPFAPATLGLTLDRAKANNGTKLHLTIRVNGTVDPTNGAPYVIISTSGNNVGYWPGIVETQ